MMIEQNKVLHKKNAQEPIVSCINQYESFLMEIFGCFVQIKIPIELCIIILPAEYELLIFSPLVSFVSPRSYN